ncbi:hypothetical protein SH139x_001095 [Planctomycetaceae bacterium SH139]
MSAVVGLFIPQRDQYRMSGLPMTTAWMESAARATDSQTQPPQRTGRLKLQFLMCTLKMHETSIKFGLELLAPKSQFFSEPTFQ